MGPIRLIFRIISLIVLVSFVTSAILGFYIYKDVADLRKNWAGSNKLILLANEEVYAGVITTFGEEELVFVENLDDYQTAYQNRNYEVLKGSNYKLFIFKIGMFEKTDETLSLGELEITKKAAIEAIESDDPKEVLINGLIESGSVPAEQKGLVKDQFSTEIGSDQLLKGMLFGMLMQGAMEKDPLLLFRELQKKNIIIYPETIIFKIVRLAPLSLIEKLAQKAMQGIEEKIAQ